MWQVRESVPVSLMEVSRQIGKRSHRLHSKSATTFAKLFKYDLSVSLLQTDGLVAALKARLNGDELKQQTQIMVPSLKGDGRDWMCKLSFFCFGHAADENLHLNIVGEFLRPSGEEAEGEGEVGEDTRRALIGKVQEVLNSHVYELTIARKGK
jgi:hypothetical protein